MRLARVLIHCGWSLAVDRSSDNTRWRRDGARATRRSHKSKNWRLPMPRGDKSSYTSKQRRRADHIEEGYEKRGVSKQEAERRAWATVNKETGGGKKSGSGRGKTENRSASKKGGRKGGRRSHTTARSRSRSRS
jgi:plasmid stabilization system protein ParE